MADELTHLDEQGRLKMVDIGGKEPTARLARVRGEIRMDRATARLIAENKVAKGNVLEAARLAGIMAAKRTGELIPLCHPLNLMVISVICTSARIGSKSRPRPKLTTARAWKWRRWWRRARRF